MFFLGAVSGVVAAAAVAYLLHMVGAITVSLGSVKL